MVRNSRDGGGNGSQWARICGKLAAVVALCLVIRGVSDMLESSGMEVSLPEGISEFILMSELPYHDNFKASGTPYLFSELPRINHKDDTGTGSGDDTSAEVEVPSVPDISGAAGEGEITESEPQEPQESTDGSDSSTSDEPDAEPGGAIKTTITGEGGGYQGGAQGIYLKNKTEYEIDVEGLLSEPLDFSADDGARVLIVHTHGSEE